MAFALKQKVLKIVKEKVIITSLPAMSDIHRASVHENVLAPFDFVYVS